MHTHVCSNLGYCLLNSYMNCRLTCSLEADFLLKLKPFLGDTVK